MTTDTATPARAALGIWPTPIESMPRLSRALGLGAGDLLVKRDDLTGLGAGGNKLRKLEWTCGEALQLGADSLVTTGAPQSNHARLTAASGARLGLDVTLVLAGSPDSSASGNLALDGLFGATVVWAGQVGDVELSELARDVAHRLRAQGRNPVLIPFGGSSVVGAQGYVECGRELRAQLPDLTTVVTAVGSGGTMAGLVAELGPERVLGVHCGAVEDPGPIVAELAAGLLGQQIAAEVLRLRTDQVGAGYGSLTEPVKEALTLVARTEGIVLDPTYTGRAMAGLIAAIRDGDIQAGQRTVFLHSGGLPGLFGHPMAVSWAESEVRTAF